MNAFTADKMMSPRQLAERFGVSHVTIAALIRAGDLPAINIGVSTSTKPRYRVHVDEFEAFLRSRRTVKEAVTQ